MLGESQASEGRQGDAADIASDRAEEELDLLLEHAERERLAEVEAALRRLADGTFGVCEQCSQPISAARLNARPWARTCLDSARHTI